MTKLSAILSSVFCCLALVLLVLGVLAVSPYARADCCQCSDDSQCAEGEVCVGGVCLLKPCASHSDCNNPDRSCYYIGGLDPCSTGDCKKETDEANCGGCKCKLYPGYLWCRCQGQ